MQDTLLREGASDATDPLILASLAGEYNADIVERLNEEDGEEAARLVRHLPLDRAIQVFDQPELREGGEIIELLPRDLALQILKGMSADRAAEIMRRIDPDLRAELLTALEPEPAQTLRGLLAHPPHSAGSIMTTEYVSMPPDATVAETLRHIREVERTRETVYAIYLVDPKTRKLTQAVSLRRLITGEPDQPILALAPDRKPVTVSPTTDREEVARLISRHDLLAAPVVDEKGHLLGIVTVDDVVDAILAESEEDVQKFGGVEAFDQPYLDVGFFEMIRKRAGWLCILFLGEMLTASAMQHFADELEKAVVLSLFIPLLMSSGGNSGSQATSLLIRALALGQIRLRDWWRVALREIPTGLTLGLLLGAIGVARIALWQKLGIYDYGEHWVLVALTVAFGLIGIVTFGSLAGSMLPFILQRLRFDPANASAPFVATLVDVSGLVIYFSVALIFLRGTLL
ncbi:MAG: magnesium transporter [Rhizobiales bacterium 65-9]|nr:magnesium transporter [Hyphomicrobiales bacterium]OJY36587.1 MAG: magnesium transporter [Rhizobiales bacterium 65-9]